MKIKNVIVIILLGIISVLHISCSEDYLDVTDPNNLSPDTFWKTEQDGIKAITATYALFQYQVWRRMPPFNPWRMD